LGYVPTLLLLQCLFTFELFCCGDRFLCNQSQSRHEEECRVHVSGRFHRFICFQSFSTKDIIIFWKQETVGCLAARISFSPGLHLHCMCLENSKTINPFFFSWIGFPLHVSREFQNNQSFLLLLDWISIACLENSKPVNPFFSWIEYCIFLEIQGERKKDRKRGFCFFFHHRSRRKICFHSVRVLAQITNPHTHKSLQEIWPTLSSQMVVQYRRRAYFWTLLNVDCHLLGCVLLVFAFFDSIDCHCLVWCLLHHHWHSESFTVLAFSFTPILFFCVFCFLNCLWFYVCRCSFILMASTYMKH